MSIDAICMKTDMLLPLSRLSFHEANILVENMRDDLDQAKFIARLDLLIQNTEDPVLLSELEALILKVRGLTPSEFQKLSQDTKTGKVVFPQDYALPLTNDDL